MGLTSLGDLTRSFMFNRQSGGLKADVQRLSTELTTGRVADIAARTSGDLGPVMAIDASLARLGGFGTVTSEAGMFSGAMQTALGTIGQLSTALSASLIGAASSSSAAQITANGSDARQKFDAAIALLNTRFGGRSLFAGTSTSAQALADGDSMLVAIEATLTGAVSAADVESGVAAWFDDPSGFSATAYQGGPELAALEVAPGELAHLDVTAGDPAIRATLKGLAMAALLDRNVLAGQPGARRDLAQRAGLSLQQTQSDRTYLSARLGTVEAQIESASARNSAEAASLQISRAGLAAADPYETASKLEQTQTQLETIFALTARLSRLSLVDFLR